MLYNLKKEKEIFLLNENDVNPTLDSPRKKSGRITCGCGVDTVVIKIKLFLNVADEGLLNDFSAHHISAVSKLVTELSGATSLRQRRIF